jgi:hypothetical protein
MSIEAMKTALDALELFVKYENPNARIQVRKPKDGGPMVTIYPKRVAAEAATVLRQAIEQAKQAEQEEPWGWRWKERINGELDNWVVTSCEPPPYAIEKQPLYTAAPQCQWVGLTADEIWQCNVAPAGHHVECHICVAHQNVLDFAEAIEAKLKEKNT